MSLGVRRIVQAKQGPPMNSPVRQVECIIPLLPVADLDASVEFYTRKLGFSLDWRSDPVCSLSRDGCHVMLSERDKGGGAGWVWIGLETDALFREFEMQGVPILQRPRNFSWAYEMKFSDPDGNVLRLGTECRADLPMEDGPPAN
jgi:catechol 2,3-dioxygenase-like lactoylglutathione lyase family enzyme